MYRQRFEELPSGTKYERFCLDQFAVYHVVCMDTDNENLMKYHRRCCSVIRNSNAGLNGTVVLKKTKCKFSSSRNKTSLFFRPVSHGVYKEHTHISSSLCPFLPSPLL